MEGPEEEDGKGEGGVEQGHVVTGPGQQHPAQQAHDHTDVLVHAEGKEVPLGERGGDGHDGGGQVDYLDNRGEVIRTIQDLHKCQNIRCRAHNIKRKCLNLIPPPLIYLGS